MSANRWLVLLLLVCCLAIPGIGQGGEVTNCFQRGALGSCRRTVLQHVQFKSAVLQFVDPMKTGLGEGLSRLLWREILESISDLSSAGVILATDRSGEIERALGEKDLARFLGRGYHDAALAIAEQQDVQISIWGAVLEDGDELLVQTFLSLRESEADPWTTLNLKRGWPEPLELKTVLAQKRINLAPLHGRRSDLLDRRFVTRCGRSVGCPLGVPIHEGPSSKSSVVERVAVGSAVYTVDMLGNWMKLKAQASIERDAASADGVEHWIRIEHLEMFPGEISFTSRKSVNLRSEPGGDVIGRVDLNGTFAVLHGARFGKFDEPWYRIEVDDKIGWVAGRLVARRTYTFPSVHLIAGLYRYGRQQYGRAIREFESFLEVASESDNVTRAFALEFLAASRVMAERRPRERDLARAIFDLDEAAVLTPFDPGVYKIRAVVRASSVDRIAESISDLQQAVRLNRRDSGAKSLLREVKAFSAEHGLTQIDQATGVPRPETPVDPLKPAPMDETDDVAPLGVPGKPILVQ